MAVDHPWGDPAQRALDIALGEFMERPDGGASAASFMEGWHAALRGPIRAEIVAEETRAKVARHGVRRVLRRIEQGHTADAANECRAVLRETRPL